MITICNSAPQKKRGMRGRGQGKQLSSFTLKFGVYKI